MEQTEQTAAVKCDACGCAFVPELLTQREGEIEYTFFRCDYCGKAFMVSVTDEALRESIEQYRALARWNMMKRLPERTQRRMQKLKEENVRRARELRWQYLREDGHDGE